MPDPTVSFVSFVPYFTCMKEQHHQRGLGAGNGQRDDRIPEDVQPGATCHSPRSMYDAHTVSRGAHKQRKKDRQIDLRADDVMFALVLPRALSWSMGFVVNVVRSCHVSFISDD